MTNPTLSIPRLRHGARGVALAVILLLGLLALPSFGVESRPALDPEFGDGQMPRVAAQFVRGEVGHEPPTMACRIDSAIIQRWR